MSPRPPSQATLLVELVIGSGAELWHTPAGDEYATIRIADHREHHRLSSHAVRDWLSRLHHRCTGRTPGSQAIADAIATLGGMARYDGATHDVHVRVAGQADAVYLDLGDPQWLVAEITADGWRVIADPPLRFRRGRALLPLPLPERGGSLATLRALINVRSDDDWRLLVGWLVGALRPRGPYPVLGLDGEQGAAKSTAARLVRRTVDPSTAELRAEPREVRDLMIAASGGWIVALDNVSHVQPWLSDALCRLSTGGALSTRALYTDDDEHVLEAVRPCLITGITNVITRGDLQDRAISITLPGIAETARRPESKLWSEYARIQPGVLGALLDAVACALAHEAETRLDRLPRMADWAVWITAAEPALGWAPGALLRAYRSSRQGTIEETLDGDPLAVALRSLPRPWSGTSTELLTRLAPDRPPRGWPESPRGLSAALRRLAPLLRSDGVDVRLPIDAKRGRDRAIHIADIGARRATQATREPRRDGPVADPACRAGVRWHPRFGISIAENGRAPLRRTT